MIMLLLIGLVALLLVSAALAPVESLGWWAGWFGTHDALRDSELPEELEVSPESSVDAEHFIVYLSGIGAISGESVPQEEIDFLDKLEARMEGAVLIRDVFPYSVTNKGLNGQRMFARLWRWLEQRRLKDRGGVLLFLINIRNMFQVAVSADSRYGPIYNFGVAQEVVRGLCRHGYQIGSGKPVTLIGWSGGGQIAIGATTYLYGLLGAPIRVISVGGVLSSDPGILSLAHLYHLYGTKDPVQGAGAVLFAGRWPMEQQSPWNRALAAGRITLTSIGPMLHAGPRNYFDTERSMPDGQIYADRTRQELLNALDAAGVTVRPAA